MKFRYFLVSCFFCLSLLQGQINKLPKEQYQAIEINGVSFEKLENSKGNVLVLEKYFGAALSIKDEEGGAEENWRKIVFETITLSFSNVDLNDYAPFIGYFNATSISINGNKVAIGDSIEGLGSDIVFNTNVDQTKSIIFQEGEGDCCAIIIEFDQNTKLTTKILYFVWT